MKKISLAVISLLLVSGVFAQEKEIDAACAAIEANNFTVAKSELSKVSSQIDSNTVSPQLKAKFYFASGQVAMNSGNSIEAAKMFGNLGKFENGTMYSVKNKASKQTEYYETKEDAETAIAKGDYSKIKEEVLSPKYMLLVQDKLKSKAESILTEAQSLVSSKQDAKAGDKFLEASYLVTALGGDADIFKYNAALSYHKGQAYQKAFDVYKELIGEGYTGETTTWVAMEKSSGKEVSFESKADADTQAKLGLVSAASEVKTPSVERDLYTYTLMALNGLKKYDPIVEKITDKYPKDSEIQNLAGNIYYETGMEDEFINKLTDRTKIEPNNANTYYNLGVLLMKKGNDDQAVQNFEKAIQLDPSYKNAYTNLALIKIKPEKEYVEIINSNLGKSAKEKQTYQEYTKKRKDLYSVVIPLLEKAFQLDKTDYDAAKTLRQAYSAAEMFDKEDEMRKIEKSLQP